MFNLDHFSSTQFIFHRKKSSKENNNSSKAKVAHQGRTYQNSPVDTADKALSPQITSSLTSTTPPTKSKLDRSSVVKKESKTTTTRFQETDKLFILPEEDLLNDSSKSEGPIEPPDEY